jgi:MoaA/NifB/PqqE/SkfB family radical SAM enzyme
MMTSADTSLPKAREPGSIEVGPKEETIRNTDSHKLAELPILLLNIHENCNCRCLMCDIWKRPPGKQIDLALLRQYSKSIVALRVREVVLTGGEPLLHSDFDALCEFLKACDVKLTLLTTGLLLGRRAEAVARWVDEVIISLDGPEDVHNEIRRVREAFSLIGKGIASIRRFSPDLAICARSTVQRANFTHLRETVAAAQHLGFDSVSFLAADVTSTAFNRELVWPVARQSQIALTRSEVEALEDEMELLIEEYKDAIRLKYILESPSKLRRIVRRFREHLGDVAPESPVCNAPWVSAVVEVDGSVRPCFFHKKVGSVISHSLEQAINSDEAQQFRSALKVAEDPICRRCICSLNYTKSMQPDSDSPRQA